MRQFLILVIFLSAKTVVSQTVSGFVYDSATRKPLLSATVGLLSERKQLLKTAITDSFGRYRFEKIVMGYYILDIGMTGYSGRQKKIQVTGNSINDSVFLPVFSKKLRDVTVSAVRSVIVPLVDGFRYDASRDVQAGGETAADLLRKLPAVIVNADGQPTVRGSGQVKVFIDNKPSELYATSVRDALQQVSAANIDRVDVITNPSARYDGEGVDAVIHIYTKRLNIRGFSGNTNLVSGNRNRQLTTEIKWRYGKWIVSIDGGIYHSTNESPGDLRRTDKAGNGNKVIQQRFAETELLSYSAGIGITYTVDSLSWFTAGIRPGMRREKGFTGLENRVYTKDTLSALFTRNIDNSQWRDIITYHAGYQKQSRNKSADWSLLASYFDHNGNERYELLQLQAAGAPYRETGRTIADNKELAVQADYSKKYRSRSQLETGFKVSYRDYATDNQFIPDNDRSGRFHYFRTISAAYGSFSIPLEKWLLRAGLRYEQTDHTMLFRDTTLQVPSYKNFLPSLLFSRTIDGGHTLSVSYARRIARPFLVYLNPVPRYTDSLNIETGNPYLQPAVSHVYEISHTWRKNGWTINTAVAYNHTTDNVENIRVSKPGGVVESTYRNLAVNDALGTYISANWQYKKFRVNSSLAVRYWVFNSPALTTITKGVMAGGSINMTYRFSDVFSINAYGFVNSRRISLQTNSRGWKSYTLAANRSFFKNQLNISFGIDNLFHTYQYMDEETITPLFYQVSTRRIPNRLYRLGVSYKFGKREVSVPASRTISSDN